MESKKYFIELKLSTRKSSRITITRLGLKALLLTM